MTTSARPSGMHLLPGIRISPVHAVGVAVPGDPSLDFHTHLPVNVNPPTPLYGP